MGHHETFENAIPLVDELMASTMLGRPGEPDPILAAIDAALVRAAHDLTHVDAAIVALGAGDEDIDEMPGYDALEEARDAILDTLSDTPAEGVAGLQAKAKAILTRQVAEIHDDSLRLGQSMARDLMRSPGWAIKLHADPIFAAIKETKRLDAARDAALLLPQLPGNVDPPEQRKTLDAFFAHINNVLLVTPPRTAAGCAALCRYALAYQEATGVALDETLDNCEHYRILDLIARSPLL